MKTISYVLPIYNEEGNIGPFYKELKNVVDSLDEFGHQIIFINDGSADTSLKLLKDLQVTDSRVEVIDFSRNFGHQAAVTAGIDYSKGDAVIIMDTDLQDPPKVIKDLIVEWQNGFHVVYAQRRSRKDTIFKKVTASLYYRTLSSISSVDIPRNTGDFRLIDRKAVNELKGLGEYNRFLRGMVNFVGFKQKAVQFDRDERLNGETGYPLTKMIAFAVDGITSFSTVPLKFIGQVGFMFSTLSFLGVVYALVQKLLFPATTVPGWTFAVISVLFIGGIQMMMLGVIGAYVGRIYKEVQDRPIYIVDEVYADSPKTKK